MRDFGPIWVDFGPFFGDFGVFFGDFEAEMMGNGGFSAITGDCQIGRGWLAGNPVSRGGLGIGCWQRRIEDGQRGT
jgi:hypothetical protein